ncbi:GPW/gp25 family protein [Nocardia sp. XZ_19_385]|uniref:GPW/gp25 family protein n=1 Tax=Nocardia sp. XZ_19_385 TaxID=2769488 RepID=UPI00188EE709|nr:GPW/gp25 family protein [Nocardia sp. XZ_19_385]
MDSDIYGRGIAWPFRLGLAGIAESAGTDRIEESIRVILGTQHGERVMRPRFGCNLSSLVFAPNNAATANLARFYVEDALSTWEPRIELTDIAVENDNQGGRLVITISYRLRATKGLRTFVYPFALERRP